MKSRIRAAVSRTGRRRGSMLAFALIFGLVIAVMLIPILSFTTQVTRSSGAAKSSDQAFYAAEAGVSRGIAKLIELGAGSGTAESQIQRGLNSGTMAATDEDSPWMPWGDAWKTMESGDQVASDGSGQGQTAFKFMAWKNSTAPAGMVTYTLQATGRSMVPRELYRTVSVEVRARSFAGYAFFNTTSLSTMDGQVRWLASGETFNGVVHSNRHLFVYGTSSSPLVFNSDVEIVGSEVKQGSPNNHVIYNSLLDQNASYVTLPSDLTDLKNGAINGGVDLPADDPKLAAVPKTGPQAYTDPVKTASSQINNYEFKFNTDGTVTITNLDLKNWMTGTSSQAVAWRAAQVPPLTVATAATKADFNVTINNTNGAFVVNQGNAFVSGVVNGQVTVGALASDSSTALIPPMNDTRSDGNIIINGNIIYKTHPQVSGAYDVSDNRDFDPDVTTDILGLIGERNLAVDGSMPANGIVDAHIMLTGEASPNPHVWNDWNQTTASNQTISAAVGQDGAFFAERGVQKDLSELWTGVVDSGEAGNGTSTYSVSGEVNFYLTGGIVHFLRGQTSNGTGIKRKYAYDSRLGSNPPPFYPMTPDISIVGWTDESSSEDPT